MGVVAEAPGSPANPAVHAGRTGWVALVCYVALVAAAVAHHEPWADEAQSWLLARDAGVGALWSRLMGYEGSPGLWQTLLHGLIALGLPYRYLGLVSAAAGAAGTWLLALRSPLPQWARLSLPFTFFLAYQYAAVARSYSLLPFPLFACALLLGEARRRIWWIAALLCLTAAVSVHGFVLSAAIWATVVPSLERRTAWRVSAAYLAVMAAIAWSAWPPRDAAFVTGANTSMAHLAEASGRLLQGAFTGEPVTSAVAVALSLPFLKRGGGVAVFLLAAAGMCAVAGFLYSQVWHQGLVLLAWLFALWISADRTPLDRAACAALAIVIVPQVWWTFASVRYDWSEPYSAAGEAARSIAAGGLDRERLFAIGYATTAVQPYFRRNIFANVNGGRPEAYWDWSRHNRTNLDCDRLDGLKPGAVLVGYKNDFERGIWTAAVLAGGYRLVRHFEGNTFWKTRVFEPESFDLYRRAGANP